MEKITILYFGNDWYAENKTSSHQIAERLGANHKLLYVECPGLRMPQGNKRDIKKIFAKLKKSCSMPEQVSENFFIHTLFQIPLHKFAVVRKINEKLILLSLRRVIRKLGLSDPLLWFHLPHLSMVPGKLPCRGVVYYCIDDYSSLPHVDKLAIRTMDEEMTRAADVVFVSSQPLYDKKKELAKELVFSPHGVDFGHFHRAYAGEVEVPEDLSRIAKPVVGFWGLIENRIDLQLVSFIATTHPEWQIVLVGHLGVDENPCADLENVHFVGPRKYSELPAIARMFDVAILPYKQNEFVFHCNPIKLREYLATGKPAVSSRFPEIEKYSDVVAVADGYQDFVDKIAWYLENDSEELSQLRMAKVKEESWENRVGEIVKVLERHFDRR